MTIESAIQDLASAIRELARAIELTVQSEPAAIPEEKSALPAGAEPEMTVAPSPAIEIPAEPTPIERLESYVESYDNVKVAVLNLVRARGNQVAKDVLAKWGVKNANQIPPERRMAFLEDIFGEMPA